MLWFVFGVVCVTHSKLFQASLITYQYFANTVEIHIPVLLDVDSPPLLRERPRFWNLDRGILQFSMKENRQKNKTTSFNMVWNHWKHFFFALFFDGIFLTLSGFSKLIPTAAWLDKMEGLFRNWKQCDYRNFRSLNKEGWVFAHFKGRILRGWLGTCVQCRNLQVVVSF